VSFAIIGDEQRGAFAARDSLHGEYPFALGQHLAVDHDAALVAAKMRSVPAWLFEGLERAMLVDGEMLDVRRLRFDAGDAASSRRRRTVSAKARS
jgi:hypothetical protein